MISAKWTKIETAKPLLARSSHNVSVITGSDGKSHVYAFGGEHVARNAIDNKLLRLDLDDPAEWHEVEASGTPPVERFAHGQASVGRCLYLFGGRQGLLEQEKALNDMHRFDTATNQWSEVEYASSTDVPSQRSFHGFCAMGVYLYVFGGCDNHHGRCNDVYQFATVSRTWKQLPTCDKIKGRGGATLRGSADGKTLVVIAGFSGEENNDVHMLDLATGKWTQVLNPSLRPRSVCTSASLPLPGTGPAGAVVLFGGEIDISERGHEGAGEFAGDVVCVSATTGKLLPVTMLEGDVPPLARGWASGAPLGSHSMILVGGLSGSDAAPVRLDDVYRLDLEHGPDASAGPDKSAGLVRKAALLGLGACLVGAGVWFFKGRSRS